MIEDINLKHVFIVWSMHSHSRGQQVLRLDVLVSPLNQTHGERELESSPISVCFRPLVLFVTALRFSVFVCFSGRDLETETLPSKLPGMHCAVACQVNLGLDPHTAAILRL